MGLNPYGLGDDYPGCPLCGHYHCCCNLSEELEMPLDQPRPNSLIYFRACNDQHEAIALYAFITAITEQYRENCRVDRYLNEVKLFVVPLLVHKEHTYRSYIELWLRGYAAGREAA